MPTQLPVCPSLAARPVRPPFALFALAAALALPSTAGAQALEEVIVTAQKRAQSMQDVGIAVSAFTADQLGQLGVNRPIDLAAQTPGLDIKNTVGNSNPVITIRGVGLNDYNTNNSPSAAVHVDEVYLGSNGYLGFQLFDIERVEVLKGPQGTLFGRNTTAGSVNFFSRKPGDALEADVEARYGNYNTRELEGGIGGPLSDTLGARLAFSVNRADGHLDAQPTPDAAVGYTPIPGGIEPLGDFRGDDSLGDVDTQALRLSFTWQPADTLDVLFSVHGSRDRSELWVPTQLEDHNFSAGATPVALQVLQGVNASLSGSPDLPFPVLPLTEFTIPALTDEYDVYVTQAPDVDARQFGGVLKLDWDLGWATLTSVTGLEELDRDQLYQSGSAMRIYNTDFSDNLSQWTQELRLTGERGDDHWVIGAFYMDEEVDFTKQVSLVDVTTRGLTPLLHSYFPAGVPTDGEFYSLPVSGMADIDYLQEGESWALFGQYEWQLSSNWNITAGLRYTEEEKTFTGGTVAVSAAEGYPPLLSLLYSDLPIYVDNRYEDDDVSGKLALNWTPNDDVLVYLSTSKGYKSGGFDGSTILQEAATLPFGAETLWATELGFKSTLLDSSLQLNGALYYYDFDDMQAEVTVELGSGNSESLRRNAGKAEIIGGELELWWRPMVGLDVRFGVAALDSEVKRFDSDDPAESALYEGNHVPDAPELTYNGMVRYQWPLGDNLLLSAMVNMNYSDEIYKDLNNTEVLKAGSYTLWGGRIGLGSQDDRWELFLWGQNLGNEAYRMNTDDDPHGVTAYYNMPRTYGLGLRYAWF
ncbi:TonB-dependent receptor [Parahaliea mediterranea]|uniref:TonB-dependent receptor n=1 Tax=Parahaliea mediterranea TaxID=651086 RepID=UPI000E2F386F|nr:TonB-dependent receptor [Parahaliea mediterranea]